MLSQKRKEQLRLASQTLLAKRKESGIVRKTVSLKPGEVVKIIKQDDLKQFDLVGDTSGLKLQEVSRLINEWRNNSKVNLYANSNKNLLTFIQQLEETLE